MNAKNRYKSILKPLRAYFEAYLGIKLFISIGKAILMYSRSVGRRLTEIGKALNYSITDFQIKFWSKGNAGYKCIVGKYRGFD